MEPGCWYFAFLALVVMPCIPFSFGAVVVATVWVSGQAAFYFFGLDDPMLDMAMNGVALSFLIVALCFRWRWSKAILALTFIYMIYINGLQASGGIHPYYAWWRIYWAAMLQIAVVPFTVNWRFVREGIAVLNDKSFFDNLLRVVAPWKC